MGWASFYDKARCLSPSRFGPVFGLFMGLIGRPEVRAARGGQPFGLGPAPGRDLAVVAGNEHVRDRLALPDRRPGVLRVFQQAVGETLLGDRGLLAHDAR